MTCNPEWKEITDNLKEDQQPRDRPDLTARVFRAKLQDLKKSNNCQVNIWRGCCFCLCGGISEEGVTSYAHVDYFGTRF